MALVAEWVAHEQRGLGNPLAVYSHKVHMSVLVDWKGLKVLFGILYIMKVDIEAPQCRQRGSFSACDHPIEDCLV